MNEPEKVTVNHAGIPLDIYRLKTSFGLLAGISEQDVTSYAHGVEKLLAGSKIFEGDFISPELSQHLRSIPDHENNTLTVSF